MVVLLIGFILLLAQEDLEDIQVDSEDCDNGSQRRFDNETDCRLKICGEESLTKFPLGTTCKKVVKRQTKPDRKYS